MKLLDGGTMFLLCVMFVGFIFAENAQAGEWYGSVSFGAATHDTDECPEYIYLNGHEVSTGMRGGKTEVQDFAIVEIGHRWRLDSHWTIKAHYFHYSDPTQSGDGSDGLFAGIEWRG